MKILTVARRACRMSRATLCSEASDVAGLRGIKPVTCQLQEVSPPPLPHMYITAPCCCLSTTPAGSGSAGEPGGIVDWLRQINTRTGKCAKQEKKLHLHSSEGRLWS